nr:MAG TPA: hypothetical protein [Caudoviricetes sp.]
MHVFPPVKFFYLKFPVFSYFLSHQNHLLRSVRGSYQAPSTAQRRFRPIFSELFSKNFVVILHRQNCFLI